MSASCPEPSITSFKLGAPGTPTGRMITVVKGAIAFFDRDLRIARFRPNVATGSSHARNPNPADGSIASCKRVSKTLAARQLAFASIGNIKTGLEITFRQPNVR